MLALLRHLRAFAESRALVWSSSLDDCQNFCEKSSHDAAFAVDQAKSNTNVVRPWILLLPDHIPARFVAQLTAAPLCLLSVDGGVVWWVVSVWTTSLRNARL